MGSCRCRTDRSTIRCDRLIGQRDRASAVTGQATCGLAPAGTCAGRGEVHAPPRDGPHAARPPVAHAPPAKHLLSWRGRRGRRRGAAGRQYSRPLPCARISLPAGASARMRAASACGVVLVVGSHQQVAPALVDRDALLAQALCEGARVVVGGKGHVNLPLRFARLQRLLGLRLLQPGVLGRALGVGRGQRRGGVLPALLHRVPARQRRRPPRGAAPPARGARPRAACSAAGSESA